MPRYGKIQPGTKILQPGASWSFEENGIARRFETWVCNASDLFTLMPARQAAHPTYPNMTVKRRLPRDLQAGLVEIALEYSGLGGTDVLDSETAELPDPVYGMRRSQRTDAIVTHWNWAEIVAAAGANNIKYDNDGIFIGIGKDSADAQLVGVSDFLSFGAVFYKSSVQESKPELSGVGFIDTPPAQAPSVGGNFNWLKTAADYEQEGNVYSVYESWMLSGPGGWHPKIYSTD